MGIPCLIIGESGSGKSASLRNFDSNEIGIFNIASKPLPFKKTLPKKDGAKYSNIYAGLKEPKLKSYVIDDSQYLMSFSLLDRAKENGYSKFTETALDFYNLIQFIIKQTPDDVIVYFLHHTEITDSGRIKAKTSGKMIDNHLTLEGMFSIVLMTKVENGTYSFVTQSDGFTTAKSPIDMFEKEIDNDLKMVDSEIRDYWNLSDNNK